MTGLTSKAFLLKGANGTGGNTREMVDATADEFAKQGIHPTVAKIREVIGQGSATTISDQLRQWHKRQDRKKAKDDSPLPEYLVEANRAILGQAKAAAAELFDEERAAYFIEIESLRNALELSEGVALELTAELARTRIDLEAARGSISTIEASVVQLGQEIALSQESEITARKQLGEQEALNVQQFNTFRDDLVNAESRLRGMEKTMLMEIDKARCAAKDAYQIAERKGNDYQLDFARAQQAFNSEMMDLRKKNGELNRECGRLSANIPKTRLKRFPSRVAIRQK